MDTRTKIIDTPAAEKIAESGALVVSGHFDPVTASIAERLASLKVPGKPLLVLIRTANNGILPARARAELVAALAAVDYVCEDGGAIQATVALESEHARHLVSLTRHVHSRQKAAS